MKMPAVTKAFWPIAAFAKTAGKAAASQPDRGNKRLAADR